MCIRIFVKSAVAVASRPGGVRVYGSKTNPNDSVRPEDGNEKLHVLHVICIPEIGS